MIKTSAYLDNASTSSPKPDIVWQAAQRYLTDIGASPGRGGYGPARRAAEIIEDARRSVARLLGVRDSSHIAFTANATHALNIAIHGLLRPGDHVIATTTEHNSVLRPLESLSRTSRITYSVVSPSRTGRFDVAAFRAAVRPESRLLVVNHASNVTGAVAPVWDLVHMAHECGLRVLLDAAQSAGILAIDADDLGVDLVAFTGHKSLRGPSGTGGLFVRRPAEVAPLFQGGTGITSHSLFQPAVMPVKFEAGTMNYLGVAGLGAAVDLVLRDGVETTRKTSLDLLDHCLSELRRIPRVTLYEVDPTLDRVPLLSLNVADWYPSELCAVLDERYGIMTRAGMHCAPLLHKTLGTVPHGTLRVSLGVSTTLDDIDALVTAITEIAHGKRPEIL